MLFHSATCLCVHACFLPPGWGFYSTFHPQLHVWHAHRSVFRSVLRLCARAERIYGAGSYETMSSSCRTLCKHWEKPLATHLMTVQWLPFIPPVRWRSHWFVWLIVGRMTRKHMIRFKNNDQILVGVFFGSRSERKQPFIEIRCYFSLTVLMSGFRW